MSEITYSVDELKLLLKCWSLSIDEVRYYSACLRYVESKSDLDRRIWLHIVCELRNLLCSTGWEERRYRRGV